MKAGSSLPSFDRVTEWLNDAAPSGRATKGRVTLVHFWSIDSAASQTNLPHVAELRDRRRREGLRVIAVHLRRREAENDTSVVRDAIKTLNLTEPCALDNDYRLDHAFLNGSESVPSYFL